MAACDCQKNNVPTVVCQRWAYWESNPGLLLGRLVPTSSYVATWTSYQRVVSGRLGIYRCIVHLHMSRETFRRVSSQSCVRDGYHSVDKCPLLHSRAGRNYRYDAANYLSISERLNKMSTVIRLKTYINYLPCQKKIMWGYRQEHVERRNFPTVIWED